jgi:hypothetical protein
MKKLFFITMFLLLAVTALADDPWQFRAVTVDGHVADRMALAFFFDDGPEYNMAISYSEPYSLTFCGWPETSADCVVLTLYDLDQIKGNLKLWKKTGRFTVEKYR